MLKKGMAILLFLIVLSGCQEKVDKKGSLIELTTIQLQEKFKNKNTFILQFSKTQCPFCQELEKIEKDYLNSNPEIIYVYYIDKQIESFENEKKFFSSMSLEIKEVPTVFWIEKGVAKNTLPIVAKYQQFNILKDWIHDNKTYYK